MAATRARHAASGDESEACKDGGSDSAPSGDNDAAATRAWFVGGHGARGLVYHAMLAKTLARAVLTGDAGVIPSELRFDPK